MFHGYRTAVLRGTIITCLLLCSLILTLSAWGQNSQGTVIVTVLDPDGSVIPGAQLKLTDVATNDVRTATTRETGSYSFLNLNIGSYKLVISKEGFESKAYDVIAQAGRNTEVKTTLKVGATSSVVEVSGSAAPLVETESSATSMTIDTKQIENLPIQGRDITALSRLTAGYNGAWNGLPTMAEGNNIDGVVGSTSRMKFSSNANAVVTPRLENIAEMTVQTDQLDMNQGFGLSNMQLNFVTRRGTNQYHGRVFEDFRNQALNACGYTSVDRLTQNCSGKAKLILNEFGGSIGGPIIKDKLFLFLSYSMFKRPGSIGADNLYFTDAAQAGTFTYGNNQTVNLFALAQAYNTAHPGTNLPVGVNAEILKELAAVNAAKPKTTLVAYPGDDPNLGKMQWYQSNTTTNVYPTFRVDYNTSQKVRMNLAFNQTKSQQPGVNAGYLPGDGQASGNQSNNFTAAYGLEWTISPTLINSFRGGFLYNTTKNAYNATDVYKTGSTVNWNYAGVDWPYGGNMSGQQFYTPITTYYPVFNASDTLSWMKGKHSFGFGFSWYRENDHYWNGPLGFKNYDLGLATGDPALQAITATAIPGASEEELGRAQQLYAILTGRISDINGQHAYDPGTQQYAKAGEVSAYNLNELQRSWGLFFQDSYKLKPNLTLNYGLRWDFTGDNHDQTGFYHGATPDAVFGPSGVGNLFQPGKLTSNSAGLNPVLSARPHQYDPWNVSPQPAIGVAWSPKADGGLLKKLVGDDALVVRAGYSLRRFTEPNQYFWNMATDYGAFYYQNFKYQASTATGVPGTYLPGTLSLGQSVPNSAYALSPTGYMASEPASDFTFLWTVGINGINPKIRQPYTQSWNVGIQRQLAKSTALELRYNGNRTIHQWLTNNINEVNVFENGFLKEFNDAAKNLAIYKAAHPSCASDGTCSFANSGLTGQVAVPMLTAAFGGSTSGDFQSADYINMLNTGQVGSLAQLLAGGNATYFCNLVGSDNFAPCATNAGISNGKGAGYAINVFQANPYQAGADVGYMSDDGFSNYHALQVDLRQQPWHGLQFDANYTWSHSLGVAEQGDWTGSLPQYTNRDRHLNYAPTRYDLRHVVHVNAAYDLPFGRGQKFLNHGGVLDRLVGGWNVATIYQYRSGAPFRITGGNSTYNQFADGGVVLNGVTVQQLQDAVGVYHVKNSNGTWSHRVMDPSKISALRAGISPNTTAGTIGQVIYLKGPGQWFDDVAITKNIAITERVKFKFQTELLNVFNHPVFQANSTSQSIGSLGSGSWLNNGVTGEFTTRRIEFRANIEF